MKTLTKAVLLSGVIAAGSMLSACATPFPLGCLYTKVTLPVTVGNGELKYSRTGEAKCISILGWFASGDASINAACKQGNIKKVAWVNQRVNNYFGVYGSYTTMVYGDEE